MKTLRIVSAALGAALLYQSSRGGDLPVLSLNGNGMLMWTNSFTNALFTVQWAPSLAAKFASCFRARATALEEDLTSEILTHFDRARRCAPPDAFRKSYTDALPWIDPEAIRGNRRDVYTKLLKDVSDGRDRKCNQPRWVNR